LVLLRWRRPLGGFQLFCVARRSPLVSKCLV
jgi:hypothetical protein